MYSRQSIFDLTNPFAPLSNGTLLAMEKALRDSPGVTDPDTPEDAKCLAALRATISAHGLRPLEN